MYEASLECATGPDRRYLEEHGRPSIRVHLTDGSTYEAKSDDILDRIDTDPHRLIKMIVIRAPTGSFSGSLEINSTSRLQDPVTIRISGPDDKARRASETIERVLRRQRDATTLVSRIWPIVLGIAVVLLIFGQSMTRFMITEPDKSAAGVAARTLALVGFTGVAAMLASIPFEIIRGRWLPSASFLWGEGLARHQIASRISQAIVFGIPTWLLGNVASAVLF